MCITICGNEYNVPFRISLQESYTSIIYFFQIYPMLDKLSHIFPANMGYTLSMLEFINIEKVMPEKRNSQVRRGDFAEIYHDFIDAKAQEQAARCSQCGVPFCQNHCPLHNNIPDWLKLTAEGHLKDAYALSSATNPMPEICGRICPQDRLCEGSCVIEQSGHGTVTIGAIERYITDTAWQKGWVSPLTPAKPRTLSVGIIGAGPAGLAAAEYLRTQGWQVSVYDRHDRPGGLLIYGIPNFKLNKTIVQRRTQRLSDGGVEFVLNTDVGTDINFSKLQQKHAAILIATGVYQAHELKCHGTQTHNVINALPYLIDSNRRHLGDPVQGISATGKNVVVIGGGDTAMDCVRTAIRQNARSVTCLYRRNRENMPGSRRETAHAEEEGVRFKWQVAPHTIHSRGKQLSHVHTQAMQLGLKDTTGRQTVEPIEGSFIDIKTDLIIKALGFSPEDMANLSNDLITTRRGTLRVNPLSYETNLPGVYAAGDSVRGASLVVWAIREGLEASAHMHTYLCEQESG